MYGTSSPNSLQRTSISAAESAELLQTKPCRLQLEDTSKQQFVKTNNRPQVFERGSGNSCEDGSEHGVSPMYCGPRPLAP